MTILVRNNFLFCKLVSKLVIIVINNFLSLKLVANDTFSYSVNNDPKLEFVQVWNFDTFWFSNIKNE